MKYWRSGYSANHKTERDRLTKRCNLTNIFCKFQDPAIGLTPLGVLEMEIADQPQRLHNHADRDGERTKTPAGQG